MQLAVDGIDAGGEIDFATGVVVDRGLNGGQGAEGAGIVGVIRRLRDVDGGRPESGDKRD